MDQLFDDIPNFNLASSEEMSYQELPHLSSNVIDGILAALENQPPIAPFDEVKNNYILNGYINPNKIQWSN